MFRKRLHSETKFEDKMQIQIQMRYCKAHLKASVSIGQFTV